jgi:biopolymer transport protein ExbD
MADKTVVVVPSDMVTLGLVVEVLDIAKASGAEQLALLNEIDKG